jgi:hypothetical protein
LKAAISDFVPIRNKDGSINKVATIRQAELYKAALKSQKILEDIEAKDYRDKTIKKLIAVSVLLALVILLWFLGG